MPRAWTFWQHPGQREQFCCAPQQSRRLDRAARYPIRAPGSPRSRSELQCGRPLCLRRAPRPFRCDVSWLAFFPDLYERTGYKTNIHGSIELTQTALTPKLVTACLNLSFRACCAGGWTKKSVFCPVESPVCTKYRCVQKLAWRWLGASLGASRISECCAFCVTQAFTLTRWQAPAWA